MTIKQVRSTHYELTQNEKTILTEALNILKCLNLEMSKNECDTILDEVTNEGLDREYIQEAVVTLMAVAKSSEMV